MKFGAVPDTILSQLNLSLPPEPFINTLVLPGTKAAAPKIYIGAATWGSSSWLGKLYPAKTTATRYRQFYPMHFNSIELNATHYNIYAPEVRKWAEPAKNKDFIFCPKFPQQISHYSNFKNIEEPTAAFLESIRALGNNLGATFLQ